MKQNTALAYFKALEEGDPYAENALNRERQAVEQVCAERNWTPEWHGQGGPGWEELTEQLDRSDVTVVVLYSVLHFTRRMQVLVEFVTKCQQHDIDVVTVAEGIDTGNDGWEQVIQVLTLILPPSEIYAYQPRRSPSK
ncbi:MAG: recombinase family protein [Chloroflexi bacterium]|nr:recombinase family protein [Chloroflexota bacterium]